VNQTHAPGVHLFPAAGRDREVAALHEAVGGRVGAEGPLQDLNRTGSRTRVPARAAAWGFRWNDEDTATRRWYPQGITSSADLGDTETVNGRSVLCTSWYSKTVDGLNKGARITFVDITDRDRPRYRHVLLVDTCITPSGQVDVRPLDVHAGGLVWHGPYLHVAATWKGFYTFRVDDIVRVPTGGDPGRLGLSRYGSVDSFGYRYLLPVRLSYDALDEVGMERMRYSFLSLDRTAEPRRLIAGEYARGHGNTRVVRYDVDPETSLLRTDPDGYARPALPDDLGIERMQGATVVDGIYYVTTSAGRLGRGSLYVGTPGALRRKGRVLPVGPEDITYWKSRDELWSLTEYARRRYVFAMNRDELS
jgi:hypothetical protein